MAKDRAFVCFCVDGQSDIDALHVQFKDLFDQIGGDKIDVDFRYAEFQGENQGDITTLKGVTVDNVERKIYRLYFKQKDKNSGLGWDDLTYIIHIIDLDGAYVQEKGIKEFTKEEETLADRLMTQGKPKNTLYFDDHIAVRKDENSARVSSVSLMNDRNRRKRQIIEYLIEKDEITVDKRKVKYALYFFSSNLDHFLYGDANLTGAEKMRQAASFSDNNGDAEALVDFFDKSEFCTSDDYYTSWKNVRNASLARGTNVNLLIDKIRNSKLEDWI